jgi:hypothetical protein
MRPVVAAFGPVHARIRAPNTRIDRADSRNAAVIRR